MLRFLERFTKHYTSPFKLGGLGIMGMNQRNNFV